MKKLRVKKGGYKPNTWMHDPNMPQKDVDFINAAFKEAAEQIDPVFEKLIWKKKNKHPKLKAI